MTTLSSEERVPDSRRRRARQGCTEETAQAREGCGFFRKPATVEDSQQIPPALVVERSQPPVVEDEHLDLGEESDQFEVAAIGSGEGEFLEQGVDPTVVS